MFSTVKDIMMHVGNIMSTVEGYQYRGGNLLLFEYPKVLNTPMALMISPTSIMISSHSTQISKDGKIANKYANTNKRGEKKDINAIPNNMEKYMAFMLANHLAFIGSLQFMSSSLDKLVNNLPKDDLIYTFKAYKGKRLNLMSQKGVYPHDFLRFQKFEKDQFYSILNNQHITDDEYDHANKVWNTFVIKRMGEYHDLYLVSNVLLLTDVFENFRKTCMQYYKLDPCHYFTSPGLSWDAMLKMTNIKLELMTDIDMSQFFEKGMHGGVSYIAN